MRGDLQKLKIFSEDLQVIKQMRRVPDNYKSVSSISPQIIHQLESQNPSQSKVKGSNLDEALWANFEGHKTT